MQNCFIINTKAGRSSNLRRLAEGLRNTKADFKIYRTKEQGDATRFIRKYCSEHPEEKIRFYACGGDGTLNEVVNGAAGFPNAEISVYPCGSGNDFVKYYGAGRFMDIERLIKAEAHPVDLIKIGDKYSINVVNCGFDTYACKTMNQIKRKPVIGGKNAYYCGVAKSVISAMRTQALIYADGELLNEDGEMLLCSIANGRYYGGSFMCAPLAENDDGLLEVCLVKPLSRVKFATLVKTYEKGEHLTDPRFAEYIVYRRCKKVQIQGGEGFAVTIDGELAEGMEFTCEIIKGGIKFAAPDYKPE